MLHFLRKRISFFYNFYFRIRARRATGWELFYSKRLNLKLLLNLDNLIDFLIYAKESFEEEVLFAIDNLPIDGGFLFIDVGSQMGQFSLYVKKKYPESEVLSFEPYMAAYVQQKMNMLINRLDYSLLNCALSNSKGDSTLFIPPASHKDAYGKDNWGMASLLPDLLMHAQKSSVFTHRLNDFNNVFEKHAWVVLKIDVEGGESLVLSGGSELLQSEKEVYIIIELLFESLPEKAREVDSFLKKWGYQLCNEQWEVEKPLKLIDGNYFFKRFL